jgi:hypothetical protein
MPKSFSLHYGMYGWQHRALFLAGTVLVAVAALPVFLNGAETIRFKGTVRRGESFRHKVSDGLIFGLAPTMESDPCQGWQIWIGPSAQVKTYALIATTPRYHGLIETDICGSDFRNSDNSGPNAPGPKNVNRPQEMRHFRFVTNQSDYQLLHKAYEALDRNTLTAERVASEVEQHGHVRTGKLNITGLSLGNLHVGSQPTIERMEFTVELDLRSRKGR